MKKFYIRYLKLLLLLLFLSNHAFAQNVQVKGRVLDSTDRSPLIGVTINAKGKSISTITDKNGDFSITAPAASILAFTYVGYLSKEVAIENQAILNVVLNPAASKLNEVVVVAYGTQKKINLTGAVSSISGDKLEGNPATSVTATLEGRLPGVTITQTSGQPGRENTSILIRGMGTMNNAQPLVIVDGLESSLDDISPNDIQNVSVLKDASSASIYGSRAANGVILVTTKRGKAGAPQINYNTYYGWQKPIGLPQHVSSGQYATLINEGEVNAGLAPQYSSDEINKYFSGADPYNYPNTNWVNLLLKGSGATLDHNLSFAGGTDMARYRLSFEYYNQDGLVNNTNHKRYNVRINLDSKANKWLTIGLNSGLSKNDVDSPVSPYGDITQFFRQVNRIPPTVPNKLANGSWARSIDGNPIAWAQEGGLANSQISHLLGSTFAEIAIIKGLTLKGIAGIDYSFSDNKTHIQTVAYGDGSVQGPNSVDDYLLRNSTTSLQSILNYNKKIAKHDIKVLLGASKESNVINIDEGYRKNLPTNGLDQLAAGSSIGWTNNGQTDEDKLSSFFGRFNYDFNNKYLFEANLRRDGSSKFAAGNRWGTFPSFSAGWRVSEEDFMKSLKWLSSLKLRASWGKLGNDRISNYQYLSKIALGQNYDFGGVLTDGAATVEASNDHITWETTTELDFGLDADLFNNNLLSVSIDYYNRYTDNILTSVPVSAVFGLPAPIVNAGAMRNRGLEIQLQHNNNFGDFRYNLSFNAAYNKNRVEKFSNPSKGNTIRIEGQPWDSFYGYQWTGYFQTDQQAASSPHQPGAPVMAGDLRFKDQNNDGKIDGNDRVVLGNTIPIITYGFNIGLQYKNFDLSSFFQGAGKVNRTLGTEAEWPFVNGANALTMHLDRTIVQGGKIVQQGYFPRTLINQTHNQVESSFTVLNSSYLRLKNCQLGYNLPIQWLSHMKIAKARIYMSGQNLLTFTKFPSGFDPELPEGSGAYTYPQIKFYVFGLDIKF